MATNSKRQTVPAVITGEGKWFVAQHPETGVTSQGASIEDAQRNLVEALELYLEETKYRLKHRSTILTTVEV